eukprot:TRINITY_DN2640_c0_g1_i2.p1 TRINITY_DN2640_c0_g1~~TRINITY_DN2640_c0_g1_i2.p1  ORF type:complete len:121 (+),score=15.93 TRINITY_DN2640_c0_g1_i2:102-464(+)
MTQSFTSERFSKKTLQATTEGEVDFEKELINAYFTSVKKEGEAYKEALSKDDAENARTYIHAIKSASIYIGAQRVADMASFLEYLCASNNLTEARKYTFDFFFELDEVVHLLTLYIKYLI